MIGVVFEFRNHYDRIRVSKVRFMSWNEYACIYIHLDLPYHSMNRLKRSRFIDAGLRHLDIYTHIFIAKFLE